MNCWVLLSKDNATRGPETYGDTDDAYRYDSMVPNFKQLAVGDVVFMSDYETRITVARITAIDEVAGVKDLYRCPTCQRTSQTRRGGRWRCPKCRVDYTDPIIDPTPVRAFTAHLGGVRRLDDAETWIRRVKASTKPKLQNAIRLMQPSQIGSELATLISEQATLAATPSAPAVVDDASSFAEADYSSWTAEGQRRLVTHLRIERSSIAAREAKRQHAQRDPRCPCEVCGMSFAEVYGDHGALYIEAHHRQPLALLDEPRPPTPADFAMVCANCHRMLHRTRDVTMAVDELAGLLRQRVHRGG